MVKPIVAIAVLCLSSYAFGGSPSIGTASVSGDMRIDGFSVPRTATLFEGAVIETSRSTTLRLDKGLQIVLAPNSRGILFRDHLDLQQGQSEISGASAFKLNAAGLTITAIQPNSRGVIAVNEAGEVGVKSLSGGFHVASAVGKTVRDVQPGESMVFDFVPSASLAAGGGGGGGGWWSSHAGWIALTIGLAAFIGAEFAIHNYYPPASR